ncbi:MAG: radical SAM protein [Candidatus Omnitrophica bacterium]|nr:radical SAM protein [Candidatus Omnitrophota bacterium]
MIQRRNLKRFLGKSFTQPGYAFKVFTKRLRAYAAYRLRSGRSSYPESLTMFLTNRCNLRCKMCGQWGDGGITKRYASSIIQSEIALDKLYSLIDDIFFFKPNITLFGGEPLLYGNCIELISYIKQKRMHCLMITNGTLLTEKANEIVASGLDELNVSLDGAGDLHDQIRGMPGLFAKITSGLRCIHDIKKRNSYNKPYINLQCAISRYNYTELEELIGVAEETFADSLTFHNLIFINSETLERQKKYDSFLNCESTAWEGFISEPGIDPAILYNKMDKILSKQYPFRVEFYPNFSYQGLRDYYNRAIYFPPEYKARCLSPWVVAYIFPDGEVRPCLNSSYSYGNIKKDRLTKLWNNEKAVKFRLWLKKNKLFPVCCRCTELYRY